MDDVNRFVGERIHFFRKLRGYTLQELADAIGKSKSTVSKYEKSEIAIDVQVLFEISQALGVAVGQLIDYPSQPQTHHRNPAVHSAFSAAETLYLYTYDGRVSQIVEGVIRIMPTEAGDQAAFYMDVPPDSTNFHDCRSYYQGQVEYNNSLISFLMKNQFNEAEQIMLYLYNPIDRELETPGLLCGLTRQNLQPMAMRGIASLRRLKPDEALKEQLVLTRQEQQTVKKLNLFVVENELGQTDR